MKPCGVCLFLFSSSCTRFLHQVTPASSSIRVSLSSCIHIIICSLLFYLLFHSWEKTWLQLRTQKYKQWEGVANEYSNAQARKERKYSPLLPVKVKWQWCSNCLKVFSWWKVKFISLAHSLAAFVLLLNLSQEAGCADDEKQERKDKLCLPIASAQECRIWKCNWHGNWPYSSLSSLRCMLE